MANLNIYKIDNTKQQAFLIRLNDTLDQKNAINRPIIVDGEEQNFGFTLYLPQNRDNKEVGWRWILDEFDEAVIETPPQPKGIVLIEHDDEWYAVTFGSAFFTVDQFCDRDFGFAFARKQKLAGIKTTALLSPNTRRNKVINTYIDYDALEFDSGESFAKLKAKADFGEGEFNLFSPSVEIGNSIRVSSERESLNAIAEIILYIEKVINSTEEPCNKIPVFSRIKDPDKEAALEAELQRAVLADPSCLNISELDIIGVTEVFNNNDGQFVLKYGTAKKNVSQISLDAIREFCEEHAFDMSNILLNIRVVSLKDGAEVRTDTIHNLIDYTSESDRCVLSKGKWYICNDDYITYLSDSLAEIDVEYHPEYDFSRSYWKNYIDQKIQAETPEFIAAGVLPKDIKAKVEDKYYAERAFNNWRQDQNGFLNYDRDNYRVAGMKIEIMDLYHNGAIFAVKIGNSSGKLCYVVDQSLSALKMRKHNLLPFPTIDTVVVWLILDRQNHLPLINGKPNIDHLRMLSLKNKLDQWKKEVRLQGLRPLIYVNYVVD